MALSRTIQPFREALLAGPGWAEGGGGEHPRCPPEDRRLRMEPTLYDKNVQRARAELNVESEAVISSVRPEFALEYLRRERRQGTQ